VVTGAALAALFLLPGGPRQIPSRRRAHLIAATLLPSIAVAILSIAFGAAPPGYVPRDGAAWIVVGRFAAASYFLNPLVALTSPALIHGAPAAAVGICKVGLIIWALAAHRGRVRSLLLFLLLADVGNSLLVAVGRWWTGPVMAISSRYQYGPLLFFLPSAGLLLERLRERAGLRWPRDIANWAHWRGTGTRELLLQPDLGRDGAPPNIPALWNSSAREIAARFNLH
jgi:hypothetical protein